MEYSNAFVCFMGMGVVFIGLIFLVFFSKLMSYVCNLKGEKVQEAVAETGNNQSIIQNKEELVAAVTAAIAEDLGQDVSGIKVHSFRKI